MHCGADATFFEGKPVSLPTAHAGDLLLRLLQVEPLQEAESTKTPEEIITEIRTTISKRTGIPSHPIMNASNMSHQENKP
jgi:hypothetical protein